MDGLDGLDGTTEVEIVHIDLGNNGKVLPPKNNKIALIDADTVLFGSCLSNQEVEYLLDKDMYTIDEWSEIKSHPGYDAEECAISTLNMERAFQHVLDKLQGILDATGCLMWELHFTGGRKSFRYTDVDTEYKANRLTDATRKPPQGLRDLKDIFCSEYPDKAFMNLKYEADDTVVARKRAQPDKYVLCAVDKDVLYTLPTTEEDRHFNYYSRPESMRYGKVLKAIDMTYIDVSPLEAMQHHYKQVLTGDPGDNVIGLHRVGPKGADKALAGCDTPKRCWKAVLRMYDEKGRSPFDAVKNMRLVNMHQVTYFPKEDKYTLNLWKPEEDNE